MNDVVPASAILIDSFSPDVYGGTGKRVNLGFAAEIVARSKVPIILAGGLTPDNIAEIVKTVRPFAVDVSSGVEEKPGIKDPFKVRDFIAAVRGVCG
jgi:phosphoribosylanthranilate isomerase